MRADAAYHVVVPRLVALAHGLGTADPRDALDPLLRRSFALPLGDPRYADNHLAPGRFPLELSWSESTPGVLRLGLDSSGPAATGEQRLRDVRAFAESLRPTLGSSALDAFTQAAAPFDGLDRPSFGAGLGVGLVKAGVAELKVYFQTGMAELQRLPAPLRSVLRVLAREVGPLAPRFTSVACSSRGASVRPYLLCGDSQTAARLARGLEALGLGAGAAWVARQLTALFGQQPLPRGSVMLTVKVSASGQPEVRVLIMTPGLTRRPLELLARSREALEDRGAARTDLDQWWSLATPAGSPTPGELTVVDLRCTMEGKPALSLYINPVGFELQDPFAWLEDGGSPRGRTWSADTDRRCRAHLASLDVPECWAQLEPSFASHETTVVDGTRWVVQQRSQGVRAQALRVSLADGDTGALMVRHAGGLIRRDGIAPLPVYWLDAERLLYTRREPGGGHAVYCLHLGGEQDALWFDGRGAPGWYPQLLPLPDGLVLQAHQVGGPARRWDVQMGADGPVSFMPRPDEATIETGAVPTWIPFGTSMGEVPIWLVDEENQGDRAGSRPRPCLIQVYGGFGRTPRPDPMVARAWTALGGVYVAAGLYGDGGFGSAWAKAGTGPGKRRTMQQVIALADALVDQGIADQVGLLGTSNGGLVATGAALMAPDRFSAVVAAAPVTDLLACQGRRLDWTAEYGDPRRVEQRRWIRELSPYHMALRSKASRTRFLLLAGDADDRVDPLHARKLTAALTSRGTEAWLRIEPGAAHRGPPDGSARVKQALDGAVFLAWALGASPVVDAC